MKWGIEYSLKPVGKWSMWIVCSALGHLALWSGFSSGNEPVARIQIQKGAEVLQARMLPSMPETPPPVSEPPPAEAPLVGTEAPSDSVSDPVEQKEKLQDQAVSDPSPAESAVGQAAAPPPTENIPDLTLDLSELAETCPESAAPEVEAGALQSHQPPTALVSPPPRYPAVAIRRGIEGKVALDVEADPAGVPVAVNIHRSSGFNFLDEEARRTVLERWRFENPSADRIRFEVLIHFRLE
ncbi:MAG: TonB family protein [Opitutales bacterium]|nr:TonB family protein [Opitutales bacterium]